MAVTTGISWTRSTWNGWIGCTKVGPGCDHCYAEQEDKRRKWGGATHWGVGVPRHRTAEAYWKKPLEWNRNCAEEKRTGKLWVTPAKGHQRAMQDWHTPGFWPVFCSSLADVFDNEVPYAWRADLWKLIEETPNLTWQLLTKRVGNVPGMVPTAWLEQGFPRNVWLIPTVVNQEEYDRDVPKLIRIPARVRGLSIEPMLGPIKLKLADGNIHWIIYGGESSQGAPARACNVEWIENGLEQCRWLGITPFIKQMGSYSGRPYKSADSDVLEFAVKRYQHRAGADPAEWLEHLRVREFPT